MRLISNKEYETELLIHLGNILYENSRYDEACELWRKSINIKNSVIAHRNLAYSYKQSKNIKGAVDEYKVAYLCGGNRERFLVEEYLQALSDYKDYDTIWVVYNELLPDLGRAGKNSDNSCRGCS